MEPRRLLTSVVVNTLADSINDASIYGSTVTLREAINYANVFGGDMNITFPAKLKGAINLTLGELLLNDTSGTISILGPGVHNIIINGSSNVGPTPGRGVRNFEVASGTTAKLTDLAITGASLILPETDVTSPASVQEGAGIFNGGTLTVNNCDIYGNQAYVDSEQYIDGGGSGIFNQGSLLVEGSSIHDNFAAEGANIKNVGGLTVESTAIYSGNFGGSGGGIWNSGTLDVESSSIFYNRVDYGAGIYNMGNAVVNNSNIISNSGIYGCGIDTEGGSLTIQNSTISNNDGVLTSEDEPQQEYSLAQGGGIRALNTQLTIDNSTVAGNADGVGGGIYAAGGPALITNSTLFGNAAYTSGSDIATFGNLPDSSITLNNTIAGSDAQSIDATLSSASSNNLLLAASAGGLSGGVNGNILVASAAALGLGTLASNGGPTQTIALQSSSPAINAGSNALAVDASGNPLATDQRGSGYARVIGGAVDIGAFESAPIPTVFGTIATAPYNATAPSGSTPSVTGTGGVPITDGTTTTQYYLASDTTFSNPLSGPPTGAGSYIAIVVFSGDSSYDASQSAPIPFTITPATPTVQVSDAGGTYNASPYTATATVTGISGPAAASLEGVTPTLLYYAGSTATGSSSSTAPTAAGTYTVVASFAGSADYSTASSSALTFTIGKATPTVAVSDSTALYNASPFNATTTVAGVSGAPAPSLENVAPTLLYYTGSAATGPATSTAPTNAGTYTVVASFAGSTDYCAKSSSPAVFTIKQAASTFKPVAVTVAYGGTAALSTTLTTTAGALLAGRTVTFSLNGKTIGTAVTNTSGVATLNPSVAGVTPGVYASGISVSFAGDANSTATSATAPLTVTDAPIVAKGTTLKFLNIALTLGSFTQARTGAAAGDYVVSVNWGDGTAAQTATVLADLLHPGQFDIIGPIHLYKKLATTYTVTVTISTTAKFGASAGATTSFTTTIIA